MMMLMSVCFFSLLQVFFQFQHFMNILLTFELVTVCIFMISVCLGSACFSVVNIYLCILILCLSVCEGVMGLAILVNCSRYSGKSNVKSFSFLGF